jgi:hypothetical protein
VVLIWQLAAMLAVTDRFEVALPAACAGVIERSAVPAPSTEASTRAFETLRSRIEFMIVIL